ncbi:MAG: transcription termination factor Rho [Planctomycetaceae bacterium]|jgi:transcription termination factor Rho|nr:transcription termination factor Rho [Planctomycetaceae bacterium]
MSKRNNGNRRPNGGRGNSNSVSSSPARNVSRSGKVTTPRPGPKPIAPRRPRGEVDSSGNLDPNAFYNDEGALELHPNGYGFLRNPNFNYARQLSDPFVPGNMIEKYGFREGVYIRGSVQPGQKGTGPRLREVHDVDGMPAEDYSNVKNFEELTPISPEEWYRLETTQSTMTTRVMDLLTPLGRGQRALIVAPPRSGKTVLLHDIAQAIRANHKEVKVIVLLIDERPEEVTDFKRCVDAEVVASSLDCEIESHVRLAQIVIERCKRLAEMGKDVFLLLDSITRLARAFNKWVGNTGRTMTGGVDIKAMDVPKKLFATARLFEEGGSLTIVGTALIETGSRMDDLIFQEFKGTGNMELVLDRKLADRRIWPAIDITQSGTRREEKLFPPEMLRGVTMLRRMLAQMNQVEAMEELTGKLGRYPTNAEFIFSFIERSSKY